MVGLQIFQDVESTIGRELRDAQWLRSMDDETLKYRHSGSSVVQRVRAAACPVYRVPAKQLFSQTAI